MTSQKIATIERLEMLEEKFGISLNGVYAEIYGPDDHENWTLKVNGEILALNGGELENDFSLKMSAFNSVGDCVETNDLNISAELFFGIDIFSFYCGWVSTGDIQKVRVFPTKKA